jgi:plasmid maintenance system antidote protein VapI
VALQEQLREAIEKSGLSLYRIAKDSGVAYQVLHRFANRERDLTLETASKLADYFGMRLTRPKRPKKGG